MAGTILFQRQTSAGIFSQAQCRLGHVPGVVGQDFRQCVDFYRSGSNFGNYFFDDGAFMFLTLFKICWLDVYCRAAPTSN